MRKVNVTTLKTTAGDEIDVYVSYNDGKDSRRPTKGYSLHVQPVKRELDGQFIITTVSAYTGCRTMIETANRFSQKHMENIANQVMEGETYKEIMAHVIAMNNLTIAN